MKKRYVISIITVFIITLSFFAYNNFNKKTSEYNNTIGIYLEDDYESNTYTLSDSSDIPDSDYIFNAEKTNSECLNATFSYDSVNNKVLVNTNKSIQCNMYFKEDLPQLVNYTMLYDGSLGDAEANQMKSITGGWDEKCSSFGFDSSYGYIPVNKYSNYMGYSYTSDPGFPTITAGTQKEIDISVYNSFYLKLYFKRTSNRNNYAPYLVTEFKNNCGGISLVDQKMGESIFNLSNVFNIPCNTGNVKIAIIGCDAWQGSVTTQDLKIYEFSLLKTDNYTELASKINVTASSIDDLLNNYSTQILNSEKAVKYMLKQCTGDFMAKAVTNSTFMTAYQSSPYKSLIDANPHWHKFITIINS